MLFIRSLCSLLTTVCAAADSVVDQVTLLPSNDGLWHSEQYLLYVRSLCSLPTLIVCCKSGRSAPFLQQWGHSQLTLLTACSNLFQFIPIYLNLFWIYLNFVEVLSEKQGHVTKLLGQFWVSSHHPTCDAAYILDY